MAEGVSDDPRGRPRLHRTRFVTKVGRPKCRSGRLPNSSARGQPRMDGFTRIHSLGPLVCCALGPIPALGSSRAGEPRMDTKGHEWRRLGCSRGRPPRIVLKPGRPKADSIALPIHGETWDSSFEPAAQSGISSAHFLTADFADGADKRDVGVTEGNPSGEARARGAWVRSSGHRFLEGGWGDRGAPAGRHFAATGAGSNHSPRNQSTSRPSSAGGSTLSSPKRGMRSLRSP